jgi:hypothetical protein
MGGPKKLVYDRLSIVSASRPCLRQASGEIFSPAQRASIRCEALPRSRKEPVRFLRPERSQDLVCPDIASALK